LGAELLLSVEQLPEDLRATYRKSLRGELLPVVADSRVGLAILQLAANKSPSDAKFDPDLEVEVSSKGTRKSLRELAVWYIARSQLRSGRSHYALLGLTRDASSEQVRDHYRRLIAMVHPDVKPDDFPNDAATQVNLAYETLYDEQRRIAYDASISETSPSANSHALYKSPPSNIEPQSRPPRFGWLRSRNMLVWGAAALVLSITFLLFNLGAPPKHAEIVVSKPRGDTVSLRDTKELAQTEATAATTTTAPANGAEAPPSAPSAARSVALNPSPTLSLVTADREPARENIKAELTQPPSSNVRSITASSTSELLLEKSPQPVPQRDALAVVDEILVLLSESIEAGQPDRFARLFAGEVVGRSKVVHDFTQVFEATKRREVRFVKIDRFRPVNGSPTFAGQIEIMMTTNDGAISRQQMFVQGAVNLQRGKPVLTSWSSHPIQVAYAPR
jgi:DnaJ domain